MDIQKKHVYKIWAILGPLFCFVLIILTVAYFLNKQAKNKPEDVLDDSVLLKKVVSLAVVPEEKPILKKVVNSQDFKDKPYFNTLIKNDVVLEYSQNKREIVYRPSSNLIIYNGRIIKPEEVRPELITIEIRNGSAQLGAAANLALKLKEKKGYNILDINKASNAEYQKITLVDLSAGKYKVQAFGLARDIGAVILEKMPDKEKESMANFLVIVGN